MKFLVLFSLLISGLAFGQVNYSNTIDMDRAHSNFKLDQAVYSMIPTRTEVRTIPHCNMETDYPCTEVVVLESEPAIQVYVDYTEGRFNDPENMKGHVSFNFPIELFAADEVAALKAASPMWRLGGARTRRAFAQRNFTLSTRLAQRTIQVVDVRNSRLCPVMENGETQPGCVERIVYRSAITMVREVTVNQK